MPPMAVPLMVGGNTSHLFESAFADVLFAVIPRRETTISLLHYVLPNSLWVALGSMKSCLSLHILKQNFTMSLSFYLSFILHLWHYIDFLKLLFWFGLSWKQSLRQGFVYKCFISEADRKHWQRSGEMRKGRESSQESQYQADYHCGQAEA